MFKEINSMSIQHTNTDYKTLYRNVTNETSTGFADNSFVFTNNSLFAVGLQYFGT